MKRKYVSCTVAWMLTASVVVSSLFSGCRLKETAPETSGNTTAETDSAEKDDGVSLLPQGASGEPAAKKEETVHVEADASGKPAKITVSALLSGLPEGGYIKDITNLSSLKNTVGDEEYFLLDDGTLLWENHGENISYEGEFQKESADLGQADPGQTTSRLPLDLQVTYKLNGSEIQPDDLAGKSGEVTIRFDYQNKLWQSVMVDENGGRLVDVCVPLTVISAVILPTEIFSDVKVTNGRLVSLSDQNIAVGYAFPGLAQSLKLSDYEPTKEIELPDYVEITAHAEDFALDFTSTIAMPGLFSELEEQDLKDADDLADGMKELTDASSELVSGAAELADGADEFQDYLSLYTDGAKSLDEGIAQLSSGIKAMNRQTKALTDGASSLSEGLDALEKSLAKFNLPQTVTAAAPSPTPVSETDAGSPGGVNTTAASPAAAAAALTADAEKLLAAVETLSQDTINITQFVRDAQAFGEQVNSAVEKLTPFADKDFWTMASKKASAAAEKQAAEALKNLLDREDGADLPDEVKEQLLSSLSGKIDLAEDFDSLRQEFDQALTEIKKIPAPDLPEMKIDAASIQTPLLDMKVQLGALEQAFSGMGSLEQMLAELGAGIDQLKAGVAELSSGSKQFSDGVKAFDLGVGQLDSGTTALAKGAKQLTSSGSALVTGYKTLADGMRAMAEGMETFDDEGIRELKKLAGDDLRNVIRRVKALKAADLTCKNFSGALPGQECSVRFLYETEKIG